MRSHLALVRIKVYLCSVLKDRPEKRRGNRKKIMKKKVEAFRFYEMN